MQFFQPNYLGMGHYVPEIIQSSDITFQNSTKNNLPEEPNQISEEPEINQNNVLEYLNSALKTTDENAFSRHVENLLKVYEKISDEKFQLSMAYCFQQIQKSPNLQKLPNDLRNRCETAVSTLPSTLRIYFFEPTICLRNVNNSNLIFISKGRLAFDEHRYVLSMYDSIVISNDFWNATTKESSVLPGSLETTLINYHFSSYAYVEKKKENFENSVLSWPNETLIPEAIWTLSYHNNRLMFKQENLAMCVSEPYNSLKNYIKVLSVQSDSKCEWTPERCS